LGEKIKCHCQECNCQEEFEVVEKETLLNAVNHGWIKNQEQIKFLKDQVDILICKNCYFGKH